MGTDWRGGALGAVEAGVTVVALGLAPRVLIAPWRASRALGRAGAGGDGADAARLRLGGSTEAKGPFGALIARRGVFVQRHVLNEGAGRCQRRGASSVRVVKARSRGREGRPSRVGGPAGGHCSLRAVAPSNRGDTSRLRGMDHTSRRLCRVRNYPRGMTCRGHSWFPERRCPQHRGRPQPPQRRRNGPLGNLLPPEVGTLATSEAGARVLTRFDRW